KFHKGELRLAHGDAKKVTSVEHNNHNPSVGLYSQKADIMAEATWVTRQATILGRSLEGSLTEKWSNEYCVGNIINRAAVEAMFRCLEIKGSDPGRHVSGWFQSKLGLSYPKALEVVNSLNLDLAAR